MEECAGCGADITGEEKFESAVNYLPRKLLLCGFCHILEGDLVESLKTGNDPKTVDRYFKRR